MIRDITEPTQRYVAAFLDRILHGESVTCAARKSVALTSIGDMAVPPFERFRNRLKVMAGLDPVLYKEPRTANVEVVFERQSGAACTDTRYSIELRFIDVGDDPVVEMNARLIATEVFDPDTRL
jgi:hypothetical protein